MCWVYLGGVGLGLALSLLWNVQQAEGLDRQDAEIDRLKRVVNLLREHTSFNHGDVVAMSWRRRKTDWEESR